MGEHKLMVALLILFLWAASLDAATATDDCTAVTGLVSTCAAFINFASPAPYLGSPCCEAMVSLKLLADSTYNRRLVCRCLLSFINTYNPNATAIASLPGVCGVSLGFTIDSNTDCNLNI
ncbi:hypothetical protein SLE2022_372200 [Rubroshorea leprosula]